jgi:hypothetical protein
MLIAASAVLLALGVLAYRRSFMAGGSAWLLGLRVLVLLLFASVLVGAILGRSWTVRPKKVAVMLDVSQSMTAVKVDSAAAAAAQAFPVPQGVRREEWTFADTAAEVRSQSAEARTQNGRTRLALALKVVGKSKPGAVVLLSDGQENGDGDAAAVARENGVPVYVVGFGGLRRQNLAIEQVTAPAVVYAGETTDVSVRVGAAGFADAKARVRLAGQSQEIGLSAEMAEQDVAFKVVFDKPGRRALEARADSLPDESNYADNVRTVVVDVKPARVRVAYVTNRPGTGTRMMTRALAADPRIEVIEDVSIAGALKPVAGTVDVFILDNVVEAGNADALKQIGEQVLAGAGLLVLAGPEFQPGPELAKVLPGKVQGTQAGPFTPEVAGEGRVMPWFGAGGVDLARVPPFTGARLLAGQQAGVWVVAKEKELPLVVAARAGRGKVVYVAAWPLWRWGFGPDQGPVTGTALSAFAAGVARYLAERDTSPFRLDADKPGYLGGEPVHLVLRAIGPDGRPWTGLNSALRVTAENDSAPGNPAPMTEAGPGVYEFTLDAIGAGTWRATAEVRQGDSLLGRVATGFAVAEQSVEFANTGMNEQLLRQIAEASGGRFFRPESLPGAGFEMTLGSYRRSFRFDPRRAAWVYAAIAVLAGLEWFLRRRRGLL